MLSTVASSGDTHAVGLKVDDLDRFGGATTVFDTGQTDISTVHVPLGEDICGPSPDKEALVLFCARGDVVGDLDWPLVVGIGAGARVTADQVEGFAIIVRQRELAHTTTMAGLGELAVRAGRLGLGSDIVGLHAGGVEANVDGLAGLHVGDWARGVSATREAHVPLAVLESNEGVYTAIVLLGAVTTTGSRGQHGHMGRSHGDVGDDQEESCCELHC